MRPRAGVASTSAKGRDPGPGSEEHQFAAVKKMESNRAAN
jgi:hypothetical protein